MHGLVALSRRIDAATSWIGRSVAWLVVVAAVVSAGNAIVRKVLHMSSNSWLEAQWWLFALVFLLAAPWTLSLNEHIRIDVVSSRFSQRTRSWIELVGHLFFLLPSAALLLYHSWHYFLTSWAQNEQSTNPGGLPQWPIKALIPAAFALLLLQGLSELVKRIAVMHGLLPEPATHHHPIIDEMQSGTGATSSAASSH